MGPSGSAFDPVAAVAFGWNAVMKDFGGVAVPIIVALLVMQAPALVIGIIRGVLTALLSSKLDPGVAAILAVGGQSIAALLSIIMQSFILGGLVKFSLAVCRGLRPPLNVVFSGGSFFLPMLGGYLLYGLGLGLGFLLCIAPLVILACGWVCYQPFIVDKGLGPIEALTNSWRVTTGHRLNIFLYLLLSFAVGLAGMLAFCVGALLISAPVIMIANAYVYLKLTGEEPRALG